MNARAIGLAAGVAIVATAPVVRAQVSVQTQVSERRVEVGEPFSVQFTIMSSSGRPDVSDPRLQVPSGISVRGPSVGSQTSMSISGGQITQRVGVTLTWTLISSRPGVMRIGPPSVRIGDKNVQGQIVTVEILPPGQGPQKPQRGLPFDPFDLLDPFGRGKSPFPPGFGLDDEPTQNDVPDYPEEFRVDKAPDPIAFLRAALNAERAAVGEQVTLKVYAYGNRGAFREANSSEPRHGDFLAYPVIENSHGQRAYLVPINGERWLAAKVREIALFPLRAGTLTAGGMKMGFEGRRYPSSIQHLGLERQSNEVTLVVSEPPLAGRPPGYKVGDVGDYELSAQVEPKSVLAGDAVSVIAKLEGVGNVPMKLLTPQRHGIEWSEPSLVDNVDVQQGVVQGSRTFTYVVHLTEAGNIDLGELTLPAWNPKLHKYEIARAALGTIEVKPNPKLTSSAQKQADSPKNGGDMLAGVVSPRPKLGAAAAPRQYLTDRPWYWILLLAAPLSVLMLEGSWKLLARLRTQLRARKQSAEVLSVQAINDAREALRHGNTGKAASAIERAVLTQIEAKTGVRGRAMLRPQLKAALSEQGLASDVIDSIVHILDECDHARFTGGADQDRFRDLVREAESVTRKLRTPKRKLGISSREATELS